MGLRELEKLSKDFEKLGFQEYRKKRRYFEFVLIYILTIIFMVWMLCPHLLFFEDFFKSKEKNKKSRGGYMAKSVINRILFYRYDIARILKEMIEKEFGDIFYSFKKSVDIFGRYNDKYLAISFYTTYWHILRYLFNLDLESEECTAFSDYTFRFISENNYNIFLVSNDLNFKGVRNSISLYINEQQLSKRLSVKSSVEEITNVIGDIYIQHIKRNIDEYRNRKNIIIRGDTVYKLDFFNLENSINYIGKVVSNILNDNSENIFVIIKDFPPSEKIAYSLNLKDKIPILISAYNSEELVNCKFAILNKFTLDIDKYDLYLNKLNIEKVQDAVIYPENMRSITSMVKNFLNRKLFIIKKKYNSFVIITEDGAFKTEEYGIVDFNPILTLSDISV